MTDLFIQHEDFKEQILIDYVAKSAHASVLYSHGSNRILAAVCIDDDEDFVDFAPFFVQYMERSYSIGKIPGGFVKREGKPSDFEITTARMIDRTLRPLFPKNFKRKMGIYVMTLSYDRVSDLQMLSINAAARALYLTGLPFVQPIFALRVCGDENSLYANAPLDVLQKSNFNFLLAASFENILMMDFDGRARDGMNENELLFATQEALQNANLHCQKQQKILSPHRKNFDFTDQIPKIVKNFAGAVADEALSRGLCEKNRKNFVCQAISDFRAADPKNAEFCEKFLKNAVNDELNLRRAYEMRVLARENRRFCGRKLNEIRPIEIQTNLLPNAHGSVLFTRGETQILAVATHGSESDREFKENLSDIVSARENFSFHYNFLPFSVGESDAIFGISRREVGHGNLIRRALSDSILDKNKVVRVVSEVLQSNGSSSMASVCGGALALVSSGVELHGLVAGVAMGLLKDDESTVFTDITELEDLLGDMDCKIAGNAHFITAMQMDTKAKNINFADFTAVLAKAKEARFQILNTMENARFGTKVNREILPKMLNFYVQPAKIPEIIGQNGRVVREIIEKFGVKIDFDREAGGVKITSQNRQNAEDARAHIQDLIAEKQPYFDGEEIICTVQNIVDFGVFFDLPRGGVGLMHHSKIAPHQTFSHGEKITCRIAHINQGKISLEPVH